MEVMMTATEARSKIQDIQFHIASIRTLLLELDDRQGWKALNYNSMHELIKSELTEKLKKSPSQLYRELNAAKIERQLSHQCENLGTIPERHLEPLGQLPSVEWADAWDEVNKIAPVTGVTRRHVQVVVSHRLAQKQVDNAEVPSVATKQCSDDLKIGEIVRIKTNGNAEPELRRYKGCWAVVYEVCDRQVMLEVCGERRRYPDRYLEREDIVERNVCERVTRLWSVRNLPLSVQHLLRTFFQRELNLQAEDLKFLLAIEKLYLDQA